VVVEPTPPAYAPPRVVTGFSPQAGAAGAHVVVVGENFGPYDGVELEQNLGAGGVQLLVLPVVRRGAGFIEVQIPPGARSSGYLLVTGPGRAPGRSAGLFQLLRIAPPLQGPPRIVSFAPQSGPIGTTLRVWGEFFLPGDRVAVGGVVLPTTVMTSQLLEAVVVQPASYGPVEVRRGGTVSAAPGEGVFRVIAPAPQILSFAPAMGKVGSTVYVTGQHFAASDTLLLSDVVLPVLARSATQIVVSIPPSARPGSARFVLAGPGHPPVESAQAFTLEIVATPPPPPPPEITGFNPQAGPVGTEVRLFGRFEPIDEVLLGNLRLPILNRWPQVLMVRIPEGAYSEYFRVVRKGAPIAQSGQAFRVLGAEAPVIARIDPPAGEVGSTVHIYGQRLQTVDEVLLGGARCPVVARSEQLIDVQVPGGISGGYLTLRGRGHGDVVAPSYFTVRPHIANPPQEGPPRVLDLVPRQARPGQRVQVLGENFGPRDQVFFNGRRLQIVEQLPQRLTVVVPPDGRTDVMLVRRGWMTSPSPFELQILSNY
jgi:hypothetical protein